MTGAAQRLDLGSRKVRLRAVWLLLIPFFFLARPTPFLLAAGGALAALGLAVRGWAAGCIRKDRKLAVGGPYAYTRNPLYLGSFFIGAGVTVAGGRGIFVLLFLLFFFVVYRKTIRNEEENLAEEFGAPYRHYRDNVPFFIPRATPYRPEPAAGEEWRGVDEESGRFSFDRYRRNREWEAGLGVLAGFVFLALRMLWPL